MEYLTLHLDRTVPDDSDSGGDSDTDSGGDSDSDFGGDSDSDFGGGEGGPLRPDRPPLARMSVEHALAEARKLLLGRDPEGCALEFTCPGCGKRDLVCADALEVPRGEAAFFAFGCEACMARFVTAQALPREGENDPPLAVEVGDGELRVPLQRVACIVAGYLARAEVWLRRPGGDPASPEEHAAAFRSFGDASRDPDDADLERFEVRNEDGERAGGALQPDLRLAAPWRGFDLEHPAGPPHPAHKYLTDINARHRLSDHIVLEGGAVAWFALDDEY